MNYNSKLFSMYKYNQENNNNIIISQKVSVYKSNNILNSNIKYLLNFLILKFLIIN